MTAIEASILREFPQLNRAQREAVGYTQGPLLVIAGPGSGKTLVLVVRALNILLRGLAEPREVLLCTFTEKAAFELRDRLSVSAKKLGYRGDLSGLLVGTIHGICNDFLLRFRHRTPLGNNYEVLDDLTQLLFLFDHFDEIMGPDDNGKYLGRWSTRWTAIEGVRNYFNKITEELVDPGALIQSADPFISVIGRAYRAYQAKLFETNRIDFAHQQTLFLRLLEDPETGPTIMSRVRYVMVDEYQDTNAVQEQLILRLASSTRNLCVVGDEDQSLYRFRGATVRNILEFPVVVVGSLAVQLSSPKDVDRTLGRYYPRTPFEPEDRVTGFDRMRLHFVAFSRAEKILVLTTTDQPKPYFNPIWQGLSQWPYVQQDLLKSLFFRLRHRMALKKTFSFTGDLKVYETCPRQYQFFRHYDFAPARSAEIFFGALVHQTIEDIHRRVLDGKGDHLGEAEIRAMFDFNFRHLVNLGIRPIGRTQQAEAFAQVTNYYGQNQDEIQRILETEVDVSVEKDQYILTGKIDLLMGGDGKLELLDFKSQPRPSEDDARLDSYYKQLCIYGHILEQRYGKRPDRLLLYWTAESKKQDALMVFPYYREVLEEAGAHFDQVVARILAKDFTIKKLPEPKVCKECDFRLYCRHEGTINVKERDLPACAPHADR